jgi:hypothetical protein
MKISANWIIAAVLLLLLTEGDALAQQPRLGGERGTASIRLGLLAPMTTFDDPSFGESGFANGMAIGVSAAAWPLLGGHIGLRAQVTRSRTEGENTVSELAPLAMNDPTVYLYTAEVAARYPMNMGALSGFPYIAVGVGGKHYTWAISAHKVSRFSALTAAVGYEARPASLGPFGINAEFRAFRSGFRAFGIDDGTWEPGPYGGKVGTVDNLDLSFTTGLSVHF